MCITCLMHTLYEIASGDNVFCFLFINTYASLIILKRITVEYAMKYGLRDKDHKQKL